MSIFITVVLILTTLPLLLWSFLGGLALHYETQDGSGLSWMSIAMTFMGVTLLGLQIAVIVLWFTNYI